MKKPKQEVYWYTKKTPSVARLEKDESADVVVIGGGMAGLTAAERLSREGKSVIILEKDFCGGGASGKSSGFITPDSELELSHLIANYGKEEGVKLWKFAEGGVEIIRENIKKHAISCDYEIQKALFVANSRKAFKKIKHEYDCQTENGFDVKLFDEHSIKTRLNSHAYFGGTEGSGTFIMNGYLFCQGLKESLEKKGVRIFEKSPATSLLGTTVKSGDHKAQGKHVIVAIDRLLPELGQAASSVYHIQTFLGVSEPLSEEEIKKIFPSDRIMAWDSDLIYQYFRLTGENRLLIGAANILYTYKKNEQKNTDRILKKMYSYLEKKFPTLKVEIEYIWPGRLGISPDFAPILGEDKRNPNVYYIGAEAGLPWAAAGATYIAEKILYGRSEFDHIFTAERKTPLPKFLHAILPKRVSFAISHGITKYFS